MIENKIHTEAQIYQTSSHPSFEYETSQTGVRKKKECERVNNSNNSQRQWTEEFIRLAFTCIVCLICWEVSK